MGVLQEQNTGLRQIGLLSTRILPVIYLVIAIPD